MSEDGITGVANSPRFVSNLTKNSLALVLAGGRGSRLGPLTDWRAKPAVPFGGKFRIIDFCLSNCINSGIRRVGVLTQYKAHSLIRHLQLGWGFLRGEFSEFIEILPAQQRMNTGWYKGTADAIFQNIDILRAHRPRYVVILAGDHIYRMDYGQMLAEHVQTQADMTVACIEVGLEEARSFGVMSVNHEDRVVAFTEKPAEPVPIPGQSDRALASMGIYVFNTDFLYEQLIRDADDPQSSHDFGHDLIPYMVPRYRVIAHRFRHSCISSAGSGNPQRCYWRDVGTIDAYWAANIDLVHVTPDLDLYDSRWPIWTYQEQLPPAKFVFDDEGRRGVALDSLVSGGCIISGATVRRSLLFSNVRVNDGNTLVEDSVILPNVRMGEGARLRKVVVEKGAIIPPGLVVGEDPVEDARRFHRTPGGVTLITPESLGQQLHFVR
ncbi:MULTISPECIES: glucose-1-phosphate adenylyltransferase [Acidithiobacillus]|jgi:glucose-1-phosphate adenylyltransferase|uniref:Glucose-1-phosphate adenylyltransferase n=3 Tax=Acidithiobacillus caldus TaxID=33059 RepID=F9ZSC3_ACICS|nr:MULTISPECIES: glucose-1-phosphate adenylyltransferase [Acidithiobacillus]AEK57174.1 Glucose-1-phosphate adenylyltransferase [Acidithiobacillus caldus SM-1]AIA54425.1 Glucose-1-phosphate adenylyltransferase [Acidithiobacillus caldus ATCC 51756]AUW31940.1 glucose-1-phosphate adenylyltransferase [Acidithiobacillus caldus]MBU2728606.1 glucose-1-phosphate adenylyltransferase [Acidithiobacillus caldus]MBU2735430.1 glucose-1-phosphate adenylyltransferase [Acidithiobacillus caldus ATCC 51756]